MQDPAKYPAVDLAGRYLVLLVKRKAVGEAGLVARAHVANQETNQLGLAISPKPPTNDEAEAAIVEVPKQQCQKSPSRRPFRSQRAQSPNLLPFPSSLRLRLTRQNSDFTEYQPDQVVREGFNQIKLL
jgi:hypothetical protein